LLARSLAQKQKTKKHPHQKVAFAGLLLKGRQSLKELLRATKLPPEQLRHALLALITHNLVRAYLAPPDADGGAGGGPHGANALGAGPRSGRQQQRLRRGAGIPPPTPPFLYEGDLDAALWTALRRPAFLAWVARRWPERRDRLLAEAALDVLLAEGRLRVDQVAALAARRAG